MVTPREALTGTDRSMSDERGFALVMTVLVVVIVGSLIAGATLIGTNHLLVNSYYDRTSELGMTADGGMEWARAQLNAVDTLYPDSGYVVLENAATVVDGAGNTIPGVRRWIYAGPSGVTTGQYGVFGSIVAVVEDAGGGRVIRRSQVYQESFSKYAYFTDIEPSNISFGPADQIFGPVHSNSPIKIYAPSGGNRATFHGTVRTAQNVPTPNNGTFMQGYQEYVAPIPLPATAELTKLQVQAALGSTAFVGNSNGSTGEATTRIEFIAVDLNGDTDTNDDNEGFISPRTPPG
jgi:type II secretory pathway pseudopilin PulG